MTKDEFFESVDKFDWTSVRSQVRDCADVPQALRLLIDEKEDNRERGYWLLDNYVVVQGSLYEGAFYIMPFLHRLLQVEEFFKADRLILVMDELTRGNGGLEYVCYREITENGFSFFKPDEKGKKLPLSVACRNYSLTKFDTYIEEIKTNRRLARQQALDLVCGFEEHQYLTVHSLRNIYKQSGEESLKQQIEKNIWDYFESERI